MMNITGQDHSSPEMEMVVHEVVTVGKLGVYEFTGLDYWLDCMDYWTH